MKSFSRTKDAVRPQAWDDPHTPMNDSAQLSMHIVMLIDSLQTTKFDLKKVKDLIGRNQNPNCGGDGTMSLEQWEAARKVENTVEKLQRALNKFVGASTSPKIREGRPDRPFDSLFGEDDIPF